MQRGAANGAFLVRRRIHGGINMPVHLLQLLKFRHKGMAVLAFPDWNGGGEISLPRDDPVPFKRINPLVEPLLHKFWNPFDLISGLAHLIL